MTQEPPSGEHVLTVIFVYSNWHIEVFHSLVNPFFSQFGGKYALGSVNSNILIKPLFLIFQNF